MKIKTLLLYILSFFCATLPPVLFFFINFDRYAKSVPDKIKLTFGGIILLVLVVARLLGALKLSSGITLFGFIFLLSYLFEAILNDIMIFSLLALVGEVLSTLVGIFIKREKEREKKEEILNGVEAVISKQLNGRA